MDNDRTASGIQDFDDVLGGGYQNSSVNMIYGPAASGKTTFCLCFSIFLAKEGKKVIFIDSENALSVERLSQLSEGLDFKKIVENILILKPKNFFEQYRGIKSLNSLVKKSDISGVVIDTLGFHYRSENKDGNLNSYMAKQLSDLKYFASKRNIAVLITNQVYSDIKENGRVNVVGGDMVKNWCSFIIELKKDRNRVLLIRKPFSKQCSFEIKNNGISFIR